jgi:hypothetical protein
MPKFPATMLVGAILALGGSHPALTQTRAGCYPYCDYTHYYGPYDYRYVRPGLYCYPLCRPDGACVPNPLCVVQAPRGSITVRSLAGSVTTTPTTASYYDPSVVAIPGPPRRLRSRATR